MLAILSQSPVESPTASIPSLYADDADYADLIELLTQSVPDKRAELRDAFDDRNWPGLATLAHQLKGAAGGYGYPELGQLAAALEVATQVGDVLTILAELKSVQDHLARLV